MENIFKLLLSESFIIFYFFVFILLLCIAIYHRKYRIKGKKLNNTENFQNNVNFKEKYNKEKELSTKRRKEIDSQQDEISELEDDIIELQEKIEQKNERINEFKQLSKDYRSLKQLNENRRKSIDSQQNKINELEDDVDTLEENLDTERELNEILVNQDGDDLIRSLVNLLKRKNAISDDVENIENLKRLITSRLQNREKNNNDEINNLLFFQQESSDNELLNQLQQEYNELLNKEKQDSEKQIEEVNKQYLDKENEKLLKYNKAMNDHYKYLKGERDKLNLLNIGSMIEDNVYSLIDGTNKITSKNNFTNTKTQFIKNTKINNTGKNNTRRNNIKRNNTKKDNTKKRNKTKNTIEGFNNEETEEEENLVEMEDEVEEEDDTPIINSSNDNENENDFIVGFVNYILEKIGEFLNLNSDSTNKNFIGKLYSNIKKILIIMFDEKNLLASGLIILILSISLFFIDISS